MATCDVESLMDDAACLDGLESRDLQIVKAQILCEIYDSIANPEPEPVYWEDLRVAATSTKLGGSKDPDWVQFMTNGAGSRGVYTFAFDHINNEEVFFNVQLPHGWTDGTDLKFHVHWSPSGTDTTGDVVWCLEYTWANIDGTYSNTSIIGIADTPSGISRRHQMTSMVTVPATGKTYSSMLVCRLFRDAQNLYGFGTDAYAQDAFLLEADFHYQQDSFGEVIPGL